MNQNGQQESAKKRKFSDGLISLFGGGKYITPSEKMNESPQEMTSQMTTIVGQSNNKIGAEHRQSALLDRWEWRSLEIMGAAVELE